MVQYFLARGKTILPDFALVLKKSSVCQHQGYYSLVMDAFTLLDIAGANNGEMRPKMPNVAVEST